MMNIDNAGEGHMSDLDIAAYVDHALHGDKLEAIEEHLVQCAMCRDNVVHSHEIVSRSRRNQRITRSAVVLLAAAAIVVVAVSTTKRPFPESRDAMRSGSTEQTLIAYGPIGEVKSPVSRFTWGSAPQALSYHITITGENGTEVWSGSAMDTTIVLPSSVPIVAGRKYLWVVDAVTSDGTTQSTGLHEFGIVR
jgi:hypothetical protein